MGTAILSSCLLFFFILKGIRSSNEFPNITYVEPEHLENLLAEGQYEEFARLLQIDDVNLVKPAEGKRSEDPMFNEGLEGGDILLRPWQQEQGMEVRLTGGDIERQGLIFANSANAKWKKVVPYSIDRKSYSYAERLVISQAIMKWNRDLLRYVRYRPATFFDKDYVFIFSGEGCYSNLGKVGGQQPISLRANGCLSQGTILHEMAHTVGIIHEHDRPDRDDFIRILPQNIPEAWKSQYEKSSSQDIQILGPYDYYSVMHYPIPSPETNLPAFEVLQKGVDKSRIGQREGQTEIDKDKIKRLYS